MKKLWRAFGALAVAGAVAAGGSAFTNSNTVVDSVAGIDETVVSGISITSVDYTIVGDGGTGADITQVVLVATDDPAVPDNSLDVKVSFNDTTTLHDCGAGVIDPGVSITYTCAIGGGGQDLAAVTKLFVTATSND